MSPARLTLLGVGAAFAIMGLFVASALTWMLPWWIRDYPVDWTVSAIGAGYVGVGFWIARRGGAARSPRLVRGLDRVDAFSWWTLRRGLSIVFAATGAVWLAMWLPHYLQWPWWRDTDNFAVLARDWAAGARPYRDIRGYNFPGHIYLHWIIGKLFGWGRPWVWFAVDSSALLVFVGVLLVWARRRLQSPLAGMAASLVVLAYYLDQPFDSVAQRDWHVAMCAGLGILVLETWPGRRGRWLSALLAAVAFTIRPHAVLFLPALARAAAGDEGDWRRAGARVLEWCGAFAMFAVVGFAPLMVAGVLDDLIRSLRVASYGGPYSTFTIERSVAILGEEFGRPSTVILLAALAMLSLRPLARRASLSSTSQAWFLAVVGGLAYRPLHPVDHYYLTMPTALMSATAWAIPLAWCARMATETPVGRRWPFAGLLAVLLLLYDVSPIAPRWFPYNCSARASLGAIRAAVLGEPPPLPPGAWGWYGPMKPQEFYAWKGYNQLLRYVRETTGPETVVANVLKNPPFPAVNGPTGRRSPFRAESGIAWMWLVRQDLDETFAQELREAGADSIVVWVPEEADSQPRLPLKGLTRVILDEYAPEARFGLIEVWRRKEADEAKPTAPAPFGGRSTLLTPPLSNL